MSIGQFARRSRLSPKALGQLQIPLAEVKLIVSLEPDAASEWIDAHWNAPRPSTRLAVTSPAT